MFCSLPPNTIWITSEHVSIETAASLLFCTNYSVMHSSYIRIGGDYHPPVMVTNCMSDTHNVLNMVKDTIRTPASIVQQHIKRLYVLLNVDILNATTQKALRLMIDNNGSYFGCLMTTNKLNNIDKGLQSRSLIITPLVYRKYFDKNRHHHHNRHHNHLASVTMVHTYEDPGQLQQDANKDHRIAQANKFVSRHDCLNINQTSDIMKGRCIKELERSYSLC